MNIPPKNKARKTVLIGLEAAAGGTIKHVVYLACSLDKKRFDVSVVYSDLRDEPMLDFYLRKMAAHDVKLKRIDMHRSISLVQDFVSFIKILTFLRQKRYDVVHAHSSKAGILFRLAGWLCRVPFIVYTPHCFYFQALKGRKRKAFILLEKLGALASDRIILSDGEMAAARRFSIAPERKLSNINNAIPFADFEPNDDFLRPTSLRDKLGITSRYVVGGIGRLSPQKGWFDLIRAAQHVVQINPQVTFLIVGTGNQKNQLLKFIAQLNLQKHVILTGYVFEPKYVYQELDLYVSTSHWEGLPYTILEAVNSKKTVVATDLGYPAELVDDRCLAAVGDHETVAEKILELLGNHELRHEIAEKSHSGIRKCSDYADFVRKHEHLYSQDFRQYMPPVV